MTTTTQRLKPTQSSSILSSSDHRPTVVLCSSKDDHLLSQDICTLCGSLGKNEEGNLISCSQCGQCYHPFCVNIKGLKVVVSKGWRCLECTVCETCGQPGDEAKLLLCDECELSCHTYCLNPPLEDVPQGAWKCHWCVLCQRCKSHSPGVNSDWQKNYTECGPCSSLSTCPKCKVDYVGDDLIIQCIHCSRWLHARCDSIRDEEECELASELGYTCLLCRPEDEIPLYIVHRKSIDSASQNNIINTNSLSSSTSNNQQQEVKIDDQLYWKYHDNIGNQKSPISANSTSNNDINTRISPLAMSPHLSLTKHLQSEFPRPQSAPLSTSSEINNIDSIKRPSSSLHFNSNEAKLSSIAASFSKDDSTNPNGIDGINFDDDKTIKPTDDLILGSHMVDGMYLTETGFSFIKSQKLEPAKRQRAKRGTKVQKTDDGAIEDINRDDDEENKLVTDDKVDDDGRKKRVRKLSKVGIGGFTVRQRGVRINKDDDFNYSLSNDTLDTSTPTNQATIQAPSTQRTSQDVRLSETPLTVSANIKPKRIRKKPKKKTNLIDQYPSYLQEAFFGKDLLFNNNEFKSTEEKYSETLNDCSLIDSQQEENDRSKSTKDSDSINRLLIEANKLKPDAKSTESIEFTNNSLETIKTNELRQLPKEDDLMDVFVNDVQTADDSSETKKDAFDPDLLSTDFNLDMVAQFDSKAVEDLLNDIGPQPSTQKPNVLNSSGDVFEQAPMAPSSLNNPVNTNMSPHHQQPIHQNVQPISNISLPSQGTIHHIQQQPQPQPQLQPQPQTQVVSNNMSPHQVPTMHQQHQMSPNPIQHAQNHQLPTNPQQMNYEIGGMPMHQSNIDQINHHNQCNQDQNNPIVVNAPAPVLSPAVTLSPRTKMSSPCIPGSHRPPSTTSSAGPTPSPAQQQMHHPLPPPSQQSQPAMSPMVDHEAGNSQYQMPASPWTGSQPDMSRQYSSPHVANDQTWQSQSTSQDMDALSQSKKQAQNWESEEALGDKATKSAVLYANLEHPNLKQEYRTPDERFKQIQKLWRQLPADKRKPYVERARENRSASKVANKPLMEPVNPVKKPPTPHLTHQVKSQMPHEGMHLQQQPQVHMNQSPTIHQTQDTRWKQPMPIESQTNRFLPSPQSHRPPSHIGMDQNVCHPPEVISPSLRNMSEAGVHYEHSPQPQMISPQTSSPRPQFNRPPMQQHSMIQVSRVRPPSMDPNRMQTSDIYTMPPSTPRPMPMQQRSPFSPQSPFQPIPVNTASSTPPITPRTPNEHQIMYQPNQHVAIQQNQPPQQTFIEPQNQPHMQQPNQYPQIRQPHYSNQQRLSSPMHQPQYANHMPNQGPVPRGPMNGQMRSQMHQQQATYQQQQQQSQFRQAHPPQQSAYQPQQQQQPQFRQTHTPQQSTYQQQQPQFRQNHPTRYTSQHPEMHPHVSSPIQQNPSPQQLHQQRIQSPVMARQMPQVGPLNQAPRAVTQTRVQHPIVQGQVPIHQIQSHHQSQQHSNQHQINHPPTVQQQNLQQQQQQTHQMPMSHHVPQHPQQQSAPPTQNQQSASIHYNSMPVSNRPEPDEATQLLEDEDDLKDLGADFNILEYADPEPEKGASTSAGKNNIELDAELEDYFDERETIEEKRTSDQMLPMGSQQPSQQHQIIYQQPQIHQQPQPNVAMKPSQNFTDNQHHMGMQHQQHIHQHHHQQQQQLQQHQHQHQQTNMVQPNQYSPQRQPHYVQQRVAPTNSQQFAPGQQQQMRPMQSQPQPQSQHRHQNPRFQSQNHISHEIHQQHLPQQMQQQTMVNPQQVHSQSNFIDSQPVHGGHMHQQYSQQQQQVYTNHQQHSQQMAPRRQMQPQAQQQHYTYQQQQQQQHMQQVVMHDKNPIVGEAITSMEFTMYEQGSGANNEAVNLGNASEDPNPTFPSNSQEVENNSQTNVAIHQQNNERSGSSCGQPQNQLLKQLLGNCSSADNPPNQDGGSPSLLTDSNSKVPIQSVVHTVAPKQLSAGIPTINFQLDSNNKNGTPVSSIIVGTQSLVGPTQLKGPIVTTSKQSLVRPAGAVSNASTNYEIKTYNVGQQVQPSGNMNIVRLQHQQHPTHVNPNPIISKQPASQMVPQIEPTQHAIKPTEQHSDQTIVQVPSMNVPAAKKMKSQNGDESLVQQTRPINPSASLISAPGADLNSQPSPRPIVKTSATKRKNNDYIAERRAALEKEKTPPPREVKKPKRRIRGPNKRSRGQCDSDEVRPTDSNSNTSEASQQPDGLGGPGPKKRARKSQSKASKVDFENNESIMSSFALKIHNELPVMPIKEPKLQANNNLGSLFACGNLNQVSSKLRGPFGKAVPLAGTRILASKKGKRKPVGYYHEEFPKNLDVASIDLAINRYKSIIFDRDCDSPGSIISGSSSDYEDALDSNGLESSEQIDRLEGILEDKKLFTPDIGKYISAHTTACQKPTKGNLTEELESDTHADINNNARPLSPTLPMYIKLPTTQLSPSALENFGCDNDDNNKENLQEVAAREEHELQEEEPIQTPDQPGTSLNMRLKDHGNVSVTLTLTNKEADGVKRVLSSLSQLIDYPIQTSNLILSPDSNTQDDKSSLGNSFRLLSCSSQNRLSIPPNSHKDLKFNEQNYVPTETVEDNKSLVPKLAPEPIDIKPEFCKRCKTVVVDRGIRKDISEIPESTILSMRRSSIICEDQVGELIFCSVHCYAASIMCLESPEEGAADGSSNIKSKKPSYIVKAPPGLPPMSPMMEDDDDDISNNNRLQELDRLRAPIKSPLIDNNLFNSRRKKWADIRYTRWTPSYFELNKSTSPISSNDDIRDSTAIESVSQCSSSQLVNHVDSSIDSNESDNSTSYSQSTSGKLANSLEDPFANGNQDIIMKTEHQLTAGNRFKSTRDLTANKDILSPWPEGMDLIQVKPIKLIRPSVVIKKEKDCDDSESIMAEKELTVAMDVIEMYEDTRKCVLCHEFGDGDSDGPARLLNLFIDGWVHLNCALWSLDVYELANGALMNVELACRKAMTCSFCLRPGATLKCFKPRCPNYYHFVCATKEKCSFYEDKSVQCRQHSKSAVREMTSFVVKRRVYVNRDEQKQVAEMIQGEQQNVMRIGSLVFLNIGQLLPHQLLAFHDHNNIFPVGYRIIRYYWSYRRFNKRCKYLCTIEDDEGKPQFRIVAQEFGFEDQEFICDSPQSVWRPIIDMIVDLRKQVPDTITTFPAYIRGEDLFGLTEPSIVRILESLPGVETLTDYDFKFGRSPLLELPLAINPTGCARTEPKLRTHFKRPYTIHTASSVPKSRLQSLSSGDSSSPYIKQFVHSKSSQYRKMKSEWRNNVVLARSRVQGLGLYAARDIEKHTMVIEYIGMLIRNEIAERYERIHEAHVSIFMIPFLV